MKTITLKEFEADNRRFEHVVSLTPEEQIEEAIRRYANKPETVAFVEAAKQSLPEELRAILDNTDPTKLREMDGRMIAIGTREACHKLAIYWITLLHHAWIYYGGKEQGTQSLNGESFFPLIQEPFLSRCLDSRKRLDTTLSSLPIDDADMEFLHNAFIERLKQELTTTRKIELPSEIDLILSDSGHYMLTPRTTTP